MGTCKSRLFAGFHVACRVTVSSSYVRSCLIRMLGSYLLVEEM